MLNKTTIKKIGLSDDEYSVYLEILRSKPTSITELSKISGINRTTLYSVLDQLERKQLISKGFKQRNEPRYKAAPPSRLLDLAKEKESQLELSIEELGKKIPKLNQLSDKENKGAIKMFEGADTLEKIDSIVMRSKEMIRGIAYDYHIDACFEFEQNGELKETAYLKAVKTVGDKFVFTGTDKDVMKAIDFINKFPELKDKWQPRWIEKSKLDFDMNIYVFEDKTVFSHGFYGDTDNTGYMIQDETVAKSFKSLSNFLWSHANPIS